MDTTEARMAELKLTDGPGPVAEAAEAVAEASIYEEELVDGMWNTGFCDCCSKAGGGGCGLCCFTCCCSCCVFGQNIVKGGPESFCCPTGFWGACCLYALCIMPGVAASLIIGLPFGGLPCIVHTNPRGRIRRRYEIPGDCFGDCMATWCCPLCALCQESRELTMRLRASKKSQVAPAPAATPVIVQVMVAPNNVAEGYPANKSA
ncbi:Protein PLANT CADMIUM RESISTANCE 1 [Tetrabaena socialis]|uniref:Protein PLANT CADMIUM RESISTANCE 1 n=1 Tax=Tetrabaena socialis TaxID=47790 RepID=A0A2J8A531_9CHLO|nr:Protein PLANT CADMIUM RESISTANCE 1 [Tetrabaena socialis]|eukprot:PNH07629.1 Protein PLANT CADMIUM RESISTANCE 1 [Tetrabaena socialis]